MILTSLIVILLLGGVLGWFFGRWHNGAPRWLALAALAIDSVLLLTAWQQDFALWNSAAPSAWLAEENHAWIPRFGIHYRLGLDGLSLWLILLTLILGFAAVLTSWREIRERTGFFYFNLLWTLAGVLGVFLALDLFLFFVFWEVMLVPMYFLIAVWGHERRVYAALKFFIFTQASGLLMLVGILALVFLHYQNTDIITFDYNALLDASISQTSAFWIMLGLFAAFVVKLPVVPVHTWLPDAHTEAPTAGSVILAGVLLKTGGYGLIRFVVPLFPDAAAQFAPVAMTLGVISIIYGAVLAFAQRDVKRLVAYTSVSHMGFVILGVFAWNELALQGALVQMLAHGLSTGALFIMVGQLQERLHTRDMDRMGGLWSDMPRLGALALFFAVASLGLPGMGNFIGELLVLLGAFQVSKSLTVFAALGLVGAAVYSLFLMRRIFFGGYSDQGPHKPKLYDATGRETFLLLSLALFLVWLGLFPNPVFDSAQPAIDVLQQQSMPASSAMGEPP